MSFIPLAEETGLIVPLGDLVLETACRALAGWQRSSGDRGLRLSVNVASRQLEAPGFVERVREILIATGIVPGSLTLEVTEGTMLKDLDRAVELLQRLKALGVSVAVDDFGVGYSSLSYLRTLPLDIVKIDRSFVAGGEEDAVIVQAIIRLADTLGFATVAEGIETAEQRARVEAMGCAYGQGFLFAPAVPANEAEAMIGHAWQRAPEATAAGLATAR
jgi:EAL domain-containing protein (putative c-di-GMP-specific phosphodiesterase class I)